MKRFISLLLACTVLCLGGICLAEENANPSKIYYYGDVTLDETIDAGDALAALKNAVGKLELEEIPLKAADVDGSESVDSVDALWMLKYSVKKVTEFPVGLTFTVEETADTGYRFSYNTATVYNGAYEEDPTADCSFVMDNTGLREKTVYVINSNVVKEDLNLKRLIVSLQGLINRDFGRDDGHTTLVYLVGDTSDTAWLNEMLKDGVFKDYTKYPVNSTATFYEIFAQQLQYCGMVRWDPDVWATANVAATVCGIDGYLPVLAGSDIETKLKELQVEVKLDLVDMFTGEGTIPGTSLASTGSAKNDAYRWALEKYFDRCSSRYITYTLDGAATIEDTGFTTGFNCLTNHDYLIARRCFFFDLDPYIGEAACDDPNQPVGLDGETMRLILQRRFDRADGDIGMAIGFPPWWAKYTKEHGGGTLAALSLEPYYTELVTCYNMAMEADAAHPAEMTNGSAYYKYVPLLAEYKNNAPAQTLTYDKNIHYFTIYVGDYDSSAWTKQYVYEMWLNRGGDKKRGKLPLMWSYNPNLSYRIPLVFDYVYSNATANDYFAAGDSGAGYVQPTAFYPDVPLGATGGQRPASTGDGSAKWVEYCKKFYEKFDLTVTGFIINSGNAFDEKVMSMYNQFATTGSLYYNGNDDRLLIYKGVPYCQCRIGVGKENSAYLYNWAFDSMNGYNFAAYRTVSWTPTEIYDTVNGYIEYAAQKGNTVMYVDPYNFFSLIRQSGQGVVYE